MTHYLTDDLKDQIQGAYRRWLAERGFKPRRGQREMIAEITRTLTAQDDRVAVIEAGTGTGKTAAYCIAAIPVARAMHKRVVISSATVALQEQVVLRDIPDLQSRTGLEFSFELAKGRGRYLCLKRLDDLLKDDAQQEIVLFESPDEDSRVLYQRMLAAFATGDWNGELDSWPDGVEPERWRPLTTDHRGCSNSRCGFFQQCPFFKARAGLEKADVIVANHDLVLADLSLGGGAVLTEPEDTFYIVDEAHHLAQKAQQHFSASLRLRATTAWLDTLNTSLGTLTQRFGRPPELVAISQAVADAAPQLSERLAAFNPALEDLPYAERDEHLLTHRFPLGDVGTALQTLADEAYSTFVPIGNQLEQAATLVQEVIDGQRDWQPAHEAEDWLPVLGQLQGRAETIRALLADYGHGQDPHLRARWVNQSEEDFELISAPVETGQILRESLFDVASGVICTSATLTALGRFDRFLMQAGLAPETTQARIPSPFDYPNLASLHVPDMTSDPRDFDAHSEEVAGLLPGLVAQYPSALVLFTSWRQMHRVRDLMGNAGDAGFRFQGDGSRQALLDAHRAAIEAGENSYLVGLASFAEGVDLPNDYCRHVIIVKIPFSVPDDPLDQAAAEWVEQRGGNAFFDISVPDAALKLVQACGRLIRNETDFGRITLLDRRIVRQRYGQALLDSLPPYRRVLGG